MNLLIILLVILLKVLNWNVHIVVPREVGPDQHDPVESHSKVVLVAIVAHLIKLLRDFLNFLKEVLNEYSAMLFLNIALHV